MFAAFVVSIVVSIVFIVAAALADGGLVQLHRHGIYDEQNLEIRRNLVVFVAVAVVAVIVVAVVEDGDTLFRNGDSRPCRYQVRGVTHHRNGGVAQYNQNTLDNGDAGGRFYAVSCNVIARRSLKGLKR